ncbi:MAG: RHS repeat-associated core domain-containing protein [Terracidiphilus sp.]
MGAPPARVVEIGSGSPYTQFVYSPAGTLLAVYNDTSGLVKGTVPLPGGETAVYNASGLNFIRHTDWLGSSRLATTWTHGVYAKEAYAPFGETYDEAGTADRSFTGQDQDVVTGSGGTGVYDFLFRKHDPSAGRWMIPDPYGWGAVDLTNPQSLNRYAYVTNNPLSMIDPAGLDGTCDLNGADYDGGETPCYYVESDEPYVYADLDLPYYQAALADNYSYLNNFAPSINYGFGNGGSGGGAPNNLAAGPAAAPRTPYTGKCASTSTGPMAGIIFPCTYACTSASGPDQPSVPISMRQLRKQCGWTGSGCPAFVTMQFIPSDLDLYLIDIEGYTVKAMICSGSGGTGRVQ